MGRWECDAQLVGAGLWEPWATSPQRPHGLVTCAIFPCALAGPGHGQGYAGARVRVTFRVRVRVKGNIPGGVKQ